jgi:hypothetical protein
MVGLSAESRNVKMIFVLTLHIIEFRLDDLRASANA